MFVIPFSYVYLVAAVVAALLEVSFHYFFHPRLRKPLAKEWCYVVGTLSWLAPASVAMLIDGAAWGMLLGLWLVLIAAGAATLWINDHDRKTEAAERAEIQMGLLAKVEEFCDDPHE